MNKLKDESIIESWCRNVDPWVAAVRNGEIASRVLVTNAAIVDVILERSPTTVLDLGCGEGWLVRSLVEKGIDALGVDAVADFIDRADGQQCGRFRVLPYEKVLSSELREKFDLVVCNFSLFGETSVSHLFQQVPSLLNEAGAFIVQTIHPLVACGVGKYEDGWAEGSWSGFNPNFTSPAPWYFRTIESWRALFENSGLRLVKMEEPMNPQTGQPASVVFVGELVG
jgi:2-polyprenyl-3-methyl-5-hydroxy-6-metoxy-1,4-benzoquinol methylase